MITELTSKTAAQVVKDAFKARGVTVTHTEALDLVAKLKGFNAWSHLKAVTRTANAQAPEAPQGMSDPHVAVTLPDGTQARWAIQPNLTDRWGELNFALRERKPALGHLEHDEALMSALLDETTGEHTLVAYKDGDYGILTEIEFESLESDEELTQPVHRRNLRSRQAMTELLCRGMAALQDRYPEACFAVPDPAEIYRERPAIWSFTPVGRTTAEQRRALLDELLAI